MSSKSLPHIFAFIRLLISSRSCSRYKREKDAYDAKKKAATQEQAQPSDDNSNADASDDESS